MDTPVFKLYLGKRTLEATQLPQERLAESMQKNEQIMKDVGAKMLISGSIWSDERYAFFGAEWFPNWKALREHDRCLDELHWFQYLQTEVLLGVEQEPVSFTPLDLDPGTEWITHIYIARLTQAGMDLTEAEEAQATKMMEFQNSLGVKQVMNLYTRPINEEWEGWGIELYPSMEALVTKTQEQEKMKWWKYITARSFLGTADAGELIKK